ncbi:hypothetical protein CROQUDRAFT_21404, partial [Cronartium quercuum f. sp. fusiforme G11]
DYGFNLINSRDKYFTINDNQHKKFELPKHRPTLTIDRTINVQLTHSQLKGYMTNDKLNAGIAEAEFCEKLSTEQRTQLENMILEFKEQFGLGDKILGTIEKHPIQVKLNIEKPYPPILRKAAYPASPRNRVEIEKHIDDLLAMGVIRKVGEDEASEITTPVIIAWHNGKSRL